MTAAWANWEVPPAHDGNNPDLGKTEALLSKHHLVRRDARWEDINHETRSRLLETCRYVSGNDMAHANLGRG